MKNAQKTDQTLLALNLQGEIVHISEIRVKSGKKGYFCAECGAEKIANKGPHRQFFRHDANDIKYQKNCKFGDETLRHKLGKEILQQIKEIKVPALYVYPPRGVEGMPNKLQSAKIIRAHRVSIEVEFYEDENGDIRHGKKVDYGESTNKHLLVKADVAFFDTEDQPLLLIELKATHQVSPEKLAKLRRLGLNVIEVNLPDRVPPDGKTYEQIIKDGFYKTSHTKWIYNHEREQNPYVFIPKSNDIPLPSADEIQEQLLATGKSYECAKIAISDLIRGIRKQLDSKSYRKSQQYLESEIQRVEANTIRNQERLRKLQAAHEASIRARFSDQEEELGREESEFIESARAFHERVRKLETRYHNKKAELIELHSNYRPECQAEIDTIERNFEELGEPARTLDERIASIRENRDIMEENYREELRRTHGKIESSKTRIESELAEEIGVISDLEQRRRSLPKEYSTIESTIRAEHSEEEGRVRASFEEEGADFESRFAELREQLVTAIKERDPGKMPRLSGGLQALLRGGEALYGIAEARSDLKRLQRAKKSFDSNAYKKWI